MSCSQTGAAAFDRGDAGAARTLLTSAVERGTHSEEALVLLERLNRFEPTRVRPARSMAPPLADTLPDPSAADKSGASRAAWIATGVLAGLADGRRRRVDRVDAAGLAAAQPGRHRAADGGRRRAAADPVAVRGLGLEGSRACTKTGGCAMP